MHPDTLDKLRDPALVEARDRHYARLSALFDGEDLDRVFVLCGITETTAEPGPSWEAWLDGALDRLAAQAGAALDPLVFRPLVVNYDPHGVHFVDDLFGADVFQMNDGSWQAHYLDTAIGSLARPDLDGCASWRAARDLALRFLELDVPGVIYGLPTIASPLNVAVNLYGGELFLAMLTDPEAARHDLGIIADLQCDLHRWYRAHLPERQLQCIGPGGRCEPPGYGQLCGCTTQLPSAAMYRDFAAPLDEELLSVYPHGGMIHLCGEHTQHLPTWREMAALRAVQMNDRAVEDLEVYFRELREDQILYANPFAGMPVERILEITGGRRLVLPGDLPEPPAARPR